MGGNLSELIELLDHTIRRLRLHCPCGGALKANVGCEDLNCDFCGVSMDDRLNVRCSSRKCRACRCCPCGGKLLHAALRQFVAPNFMSRVDLVCHRLQPTTLEHC